MPALNRRDVLRASGSLIITLASSGRAAAQGAVSGKPAMTPDELDSWIAILPDGSVTAFFGKTDVGLNIDVAIGQMVAEELDVAFDKVNVVMGDTALACDQGGTSGSTGIRLGGVALRNAAAEARRVLVERASTVLGRPASELRVENGIVYVPNASAQRVSYGRLIGNKHFHHKLEWNKQYGNPLEIKGAARPKSPAEYKVVGKSPPNKKITEKVMGRTQYVTDISVTGMLHARVIRPPSAACNPVAIDETSIQAIPGARVVREKDFIAVVADREWDAISAAQALKVTWSPETKPFPPMEKLHQHIRDAKPNGGGTEFNHGDVDAALRVAARVITAEYEWPHQSHASLGPACAIADMVSKNPRVWTATQKPYDAALGCAMIAGLAPGAVRGTWTPGPGSYGRNDAGDAAIDAALISRLTRRPVRVQYDRKDATAWDPKSPAVVCSARAGLDASGRVIAYHFHGKGFSRQDIIQREAHAKDTLAGQLIGYEKKGVMILETPDEHYEFDNKRLSWETIPALLDRASPLRTAHMRDPLGLEIHFASESFIDELAHVTGADPVAFRLRHLTEERAIAAIKAAAAKAQWEARPASSRGKGDLMKGRGFAYAQVKGTVIAMAVEVEVERNSGRIWARRFWVAHDCGQIINPGSLHGVIEGNVVQAISRTLFEEVKFDENRVLSDDWVTYPILELSDAPESIDIVLIDRPELAPAAAGECAMRVVPAALGNAVFDATGVRLRRAPLTPERMKTALA